MDAVSGFCLAIDVTDRDAQNVAKSKGLPWSIAKGRDTYCPVGEFLPRSGDDYRHFLLECYVDGELRQNGSVSDMIFDVPALLDYVAPRVTLNEGDLLLTGTPEGVGPVKGGQTIHALLKGKEGDILSELYVDVVDE